MSQAHTGKEPSWTRVRPLSDRERKNATAERLRTIREQQIRQFDEYRQKRQRQPHWAQDDLLEALYRAGVHVDFSQIVRLERGTAPLHLELAENIGDVLSEFEVQKALISHANRGGGSVN